MTIRGFIEELKKHNVNFDKDLAIAFGEDDGEDFVIEESDLTIFLIQAEWGEKIQHSFLDDKNTN